MIKPLYKFPFFIEDNVLPQNELDKLDAACVKRFDSIPDYHHPYNTDTYKLSRESGIEILKSEEYDHISSIVLQRARLMMSEIGYSADQQKRLKISNAWFAAYKVGDAVSMHVHRPSFLSAAFYIRNTIDCKLRFIHNMYNMNEYPEGDFNNEWTKNFTDMDCPPGRLLIFPSTAVHGSDKIKGDQSGVVKLMLSYNFILKDA